MSPETILIILALVISFYMAWNIGANDVANAMGTSVGSGALTLKWAIIVAALMEFAGAFLVGSHVTNTVRKGIIEPVVFTGHPNSYIYGMMAALLAAGAWLNIASFRGWPVSTTHSIVGSVLGFGIVFSGFSSIHWDTVSQIAASWVVSPLLSGTISFLIFCLLRKMIFYSKTPVKSAQKMTPFLVFFVLGILTLVMVFKGLKNLHMDLSLYDALILASLIGSIGALVSIPLVNRINSTSTEENHDDHIDPKVEKSMLKVVMHLRRVKESTTGELSDEVTKILDSSEKISNQLEKYTHIKHVSTDYLTVEKIFVYLQILSACFVAFAHGANDVANAIGPLAGILSAVSSGVIEMKAQVPLFVLLLGGLGIVIGLATWGWRVIETIGKCITELTPTRGFAAEFGAAITIVLASKLALPVSTTHTLVGAVLGVGLARGLNSLNLSTIRDILISWVITIPAGAGITIVFYYIIRYAFTGQFA
ncbi:phosphate/sulphate permeases [Candidatus Scalindua japonica]|uniref:Phosphate transporter n=1 Tax=Candidatus Scalindua japonica TaxID=1284222 RepID=A0A286TUR9_9BACT|nr:inorganic phosphate transporter [Candidatus Scalindua japonica]GAX59637.1 phosphate/sulphate permeases [Candidatus Scalindua japonica]